MGSYSVALTVTNSMGSDTATKADYIVVDFADVDSSSWAYQQIMACAEAGIVKGYSDGSYAPSGAVTRDQMAVYIARALCDGDAGVPAGPSTASSRMCRRTIGRSSM